MELLIVTSNIYSTIFYHYLFCLQLNLKFKKAFDPVNHKLFLICPQTDCLSLISLVDPNIRNGDWTSRALHIERNSMLFCKWSLFGVSIHYSHQTSNAWCIWHAETLHCHYVHRNKRCLVSNPQCKIFFSDICRHACVTLDWEQQHKFRRI